MSNTSLRVEAGSLFEQDAMTAFATYASLSHAFNLPSLPQLCNANPALETLRLVAGQRPVGKTHAAYDSKLPRGLKHKAPSGGNAYKHALHTDEFKKFRPIAVDSAALGIIDLTAEDNDEDFCGAGLCDADALAAGLRRVHPKRACHYYSWFGLSGVVGTLLERNSPSERHRIWDAFLSWSKGYPRYDEAENVEIVERARRKVLAGVPMPGLQLLGRIVEHDNMPSGSAPLPQTGVKRKTRSASPPSGQACPSE